MRESCREAFRYDSCKDGLSGLLTSSIFIRSAEAERQLDGEPDPEIVPEQEGPSTKDIDVVAES